MAWWNQNRMGGYGGFQQPQFQGGWGNAQQSQWGGGYQPQQNFGGFGGFGGSPFGGGQQWQGGGQNWGGGYGYNQPQQQPYFGGMMGYQPEQRQSYGQFNQPQQGVQEYQSNRMGRGAPMQDSMGGDMGVKSQDMPQDNRQAYRNAMSQGSQGGQRFEGQRPTADPESKIAYLQKKQEEINARDGTNYKIDQGEFDAIRNGTPRGQQQMDGGNQTYGSMMGKFSGGGWR